MFSLAARRTIDEDGAHFRSHLDGSAHLLTPEKAVDIQAQLGSDIAMVLDECLAHPSDAAVVRASMERTLRWAGRARERFLVAPRRRRRHRHQSGTGAVRHRAGRRLPGAARGERARDGRDRLRGLRDRRTERRRAERGDVRRRSRTTPWLPEDRPRYLMGAGTPLDLVESVARGVDLFDCVLPTRNARNGQLFTSEGTHQHQERAVRRRRSAARSRLRLLHVPDGFAAPICGILFCDGRNQRVHP